MGSASRDRVVATVSDSLRRVPACQIFPASRRKARLGGTPNSTRETRMLPRSFSLGGREVPSEYRYLNRTNVTSGSQINESRNVVANEPLPSDSSEHFPGDTRWMRLPGQEHGYAGRPNRPKEP
jgi:hypothetical protein